MLKKFVGLFGSRERFLRTIVHGSDRRVSEDDLLKNSPFRRFVLFIHMREFLPLLPGILIRPRYGCVDGVRPLLSQGGESPGRSKAALSRWAASSLRTDPSRVGSQRCPKTKDLGSYWGPQLREVPRLGVGHIQMKRGMGEEKAGAKS